MITPAEVLDRWRYWRDTDRIGPDIPGTHWKLHFNKSMRRLCEAKFKYFASTAEFRPGAYAIVCSKIELHERVVIRPGTMLFADPRPNGAGIVIEDNVMLGSGVHIYPSNHRFEDLSIPIIDQGHYPSKAVILKNGCWIGANSVILPGVTIGVNAVVGAGSIVTKDVEEFTIVVGNPAKIIRTLN
ncbi:MAG: acyltransferase [Candidatus Berkelbacteria bacterium]|nr:acyltransferase [Candidatus Berkelbacteria bacterium]